jgi:uncharacterized membrane protein YbhN (UPF0104 family)
MIEDLGLPKIWQELTGARVRVVWAALSLVLVVVALAWLLSGQDWPAIVRTLRNAEPGALALAALCVVLTHLLRVLRWHVLLPGTQTGWPQLAWAVLGAQTINWLSPLRVGEVWRAAVVAGRDMPVLWNVGRSIIAEKAIDALVLGCAALWWALASGGVSDSTVWRLLATALALALLFAASRALRSNRLTQWVANKWPDAASQRDLRKLMPPLPAAAVARALLLGIGVWGIGMGPGYFTARALGFDISALQLIAFMLAVQVGISAATVPGNLGVFPLAALAVLPGLGISEPNAAAFGTLLYGVVYAVQTVLTLISFGIINGRSRA